MERDKRKKTSGNILSERGLFIKICPLGTGLVMHQLPTEGDEFTAHLTLTEARELASALVVAVHNARQSMVGTKNVSSLFVQGFRIDQIASQLNLTSKEVRAELIARGLLKDTDSI